MICNINIQSEMCSIHTDLHSIKSRCLEAPFYTLPFPVFIISLYFNLINLVYLYIYRLFIKLIYIYIYIQHTPDSWLRYSKLSARSTSSLAWATLKTLLNSSPPIHVVGGSVYLYTDSLFAQIGDSNHKCSASLEVEC